MWLTFKLSLLATPTLSNNVCAACSFALTCGIGSSLSKTSTNFFAALGAECAMVESLDYYVGQLINYLKQTDDPRWPGHKLIDNTYIIFTSDNGGMEKVPNEIITDNAPLDKGKINAKEGYFFLYQTSRERKSKLTARKA